MNYGRRNAFCELRAVRGEVLGAEADEARVLLDVQGCGNCGAEAGVGEEEAGEGAGLVCGDGGCAAGADGGE